MGLLAIRQTEGEADAGTWRKVPEGVMHYCSRCGATVIIPLAADPKQPKEMEVGPDGVVLDFHHDDCMDPPFRQGIRLLDFAQGK